MHPGACAGSGADPLLAAPALADPTGCQESTEGNDVIVCSRLDDFRATRDTIRSLGSEAAGDPQP